MKTEAASFLFFSIPLLAVGLAKEARKHVLLFPMYADKNSKDTKKGLTTRPSPFFSPLFYDLTFSKRKVVFRHKRDSVLDVLLTEVFCRLRQAVFFKRVHGLAHIMARTEASNDAVKKKNKKKKAGIKCVRSVPQTRWDSLRRHHVYSSR